MNSDSYTRKINTELVKESNVPQEKQKEVLDRLDKINSEEMRPKVVDKISPEKLKQLEHARNTMNKADRQNKIITKQINKINMLPPVERQEYTIGSFLLDMEKGKIMYDHSVAKEIVDSSFIDRNGLRLHPLTGEHNGQLSFGQEAERVLLDPVDIGSKKRFLFSDFTETHDYKEAAKLGSIKIPEPQDILKMNQELIGRKIRADEEDDDKNEHDHYE